MLKKLILPVSFLVALLSGCYTVSSHPDVYISSENGKLRVQELNVQNNCFDCHSSTEVEEYKKLIPVNEDDYAYAQNKYYLYSTYDLYDYYNPEPWWDSYEFVSSSSSGYSSSDTTFAMDEYHPPRPILIGGPSVINLPPPSVSAPPASSTDETASKSRTNGSTRSDNGSSTRNNSGERSNNSRKKR